MAQNRNYFASGADAAKVASVSHAMAVSTYTPDIARAPELVDTLWEDLRAVPGVSAAPSFTSNPRFLISCYDSRSHLT